MGANIAFFLAEQHIGFVHIFHEESGIATGKSLDLLEAAPIRKYSTYISPTTDLVDLIKKDAIVLALGNSSDTESSTLERARKTVATLEPYLEPLSQSESPIVVASEPFEIITTYLGMKIPKIRDRLITMSSYIDSVRLSSLLSTSLSINSSDVSATVLGHHGGTTIMDTDYVSVSGIPITSLMTEKKFEEIANTVKNYDNDFLQLTQRNYPFYGPAACCTSLLKSIVNAAPQIIPVAVPDSQTGVAVGKPHYVFGYNGTLHLEERTPTLSTSSQELLKKAETEIASLAKELL